MVHPCEQQTDRPNTDTDADRQTDRQTCYVKTSVAISCIYTPSAYDLGEQK